MKKNLQNIYKKSKLGQELLKDLDNRRKIEVRV